MRAPFRSAALLSVLSVCGAASASAQSRIEHWGGQASLSTVPPLPPGVNYVDARVGILRFFIEPPGIRAHAIALRDDGNVVVFGETSWGQGNVPLLPPGMSYVEVDAGPAFCVARRSDGRIFTWGISMWGNLTPPPLPPDTTYVEVAAGHTHIVARRSDGAIVTWGGGAPTLEQAPPGTTYTKVEAGMAYVLALRSDGQLLAWGYSPTVQGTNVPPLPPGVRYVDMVAGMDHNLALRSDGVVVAFGSNWDDKCDVPPFAPGTVTGLAAGPSYSAARLHDGSLSFWGNLGSGHGAVPTLAPGERFTTLSAGEGFFVAVVRSGVDIYGEARPNSLGCTPSIAAVGTPSATQSAGFTLSCANVRNNALGMLMYTVNGARAATPFQCATRLVGPANIRRTPIRSAGGTPPGTPDCSGVFALDMNAYAAGAAGGSPSPLLAQPGTLVHAQWWGRDNGYAPPCNTMLSNAAEYVVLP